MSPHISTQLFLVRHGETEWSKSGQHTGRTDVTLTDKGRAQAVGLLPALSKIEFSLVLSSPLSRASETASLAGIGEQAQFTPDLSEFDYGQYEGLTTPHIREQVSDWTVWTHPCPGGETLEDVGVRASRVIGRARLTGGNVAIISHGHMLRILCAVYLGMPPSAGQHFQLDTCALCLLSSEHEAPTIKLWNIPSDLAANLSLS